MTIAATLNPVAPNAKLVLAADDAAESLLLLGKVVESAGYAFMGASSGPECLSLMLRFVPRLILLDVDMPEMSGFETCRRLRANHALTQIPIAFLSARTSFEDVAEGLQAGGNDFIVKPFDRGRIVERLRHWTRRRV